MNNKIYIGIDCGLDGGIVTLDSAGNIIDQRVMPVVEIGKGRKIDLHELSDFLQMRLGKAPTIIIEQPGAHAPSAAGLRSMTYSFAVCEALCVAHGLRYHEVPVSYHRRVGVSKITGTLSGSVRAGWKILYTVFRHR